MIKSDHEADHEDRSKNELLFVTNEMRSDEMKLKSK